MITFLVVGRNDYYGINLHKRTALSLNYFGSLCQEADDEIVYVDCNTPPYELTLAEAIADTLMPETRQRLRIFRVTGEQMSTALGETPLKFSDELSRNVGLRRSNPANQWVLSTNPDILVFPIASNLHDVLRTLPPRFYVCPRSGISYGQWQALDRQNVAQMTDLCEALVQRGVRPPAEREPWLRFSSVGDFQLAPRSQWLEIGGCEEGMKLWGHSDANNSRRLNLLNGGGRTPDLGDQICVLHLDHNPTAESAHEKVLVNNDWDHWVANVTTPRSRNAEDWGLKDVDIPEIRLEAKEVGAKEILTKHRRERTLFRRLRMKLISLFWRKVGRLALWAEKKSGV